MGYMRSISLYEPIYTVKKIWITILNTAKNNFFVNFFFLRLLSGLWYYLQCIVIYLSSRGKLFYEPERQKKHVLSPVQHLVVYSWFRSRMETKQTPVDILNFVNDTVLITVMFVTSGSGKTWTRFFVLGKVLLKVSVFKDKTWNG